jgi:NAD(P)H-nitrite reductase large subunit
MVNRPASKSPVVCACLKLTRAEVVSCIHRAGCRTLADLKAACEAGAGCTVCHADLQKLLEKTNAHAR